PVIFLENEMLYGQSFEIPDDEDHLVPIGQANVVREGTDVTLTGFSRTVEFCLAAAEALAADDISAEVIDLRTLRPLDMETVLASVRKTNRMVAVEEGWPVAGMAAELSAAVMEQAFDDLDAPVLRVNSLDVPMAYATNLESLTLPSSERVIAAAKEVVYR
ncbi:MAG: transketolase C-terminal domain-containing protein, partial [Alphaproteobacteria bacterium]|nr:transketolase C-terminal domain-containing protein [Alphaproteobacteria bacterium]